MPKLSEPLLQIEDLSKIYHIRQGFASQEFHAVDKASIVIDSDKPEIFAVVGESGSGKTTLAKMVLGMEVASQGILRYKDPRHQRHQQARAEELVLPRSAAGIPGPLRRLQPAQADRPLPV